MSPRAASRRGPSRRLAGSPVLDEPWPSLRRAYHALYQRCVALLTRFDLSLSEYTVLALCARSPTMASELARTVGITPAGLTDVIDRLEGRRFVRRVAHPTDRRAVLVRLTPAGERIYREAKSAMLAIIRDLDRTMTDAQRKSLELGLNALLQALPEDPD